jgi:hypothetical protein
MGAQGERRRNEAPSTSGCCCCGGREGEEGRRAAAGMGARGRGGEERGRIGEDKGNGETTPIHPALIQIFRSESARLTAPAKRATAADVWTHLAVGPKRAHRRVHNGHCIISSSGKDRPGKKQHTQPAANQMALSCKNKRFRLDGGKIEQFTFAELCEAPMGGQLLYL